MSISSTKDFPTEKSPSFSPLEGLPRSVQWGILLALSIVTTHLLGLLGLPATLLLGAIIAAILIGIGGGSLRVPRPFHYAAQAVIGCLIARAITPSILGTFVKGWPLFLGSVLSVVVASSLLGWVLGKLKILPGTTAIWGLAPGAASVMMLMAEAFGADFRLVAFMQYFRVVLVTLAASLIARFVLHIHTAATVHASWFPALHALPFIETVALALLGGIAGRLTRIPAGIMLVPMFAGTVLHGTGLLAIELPPWLLAISYTLLGWSVGMGFTREILLHAVRLLPQTLLAIGLLMLFCAGVALLLVKMAGIDLLTAYLATSPGGMDSAVIIAASSKVDVSFVMALQTVRFMVVLLAGPALSRFMASRIDPQPLPFPVTAPSLTHAEAETLAQIREDEDELD